MTKRYLEEHVVDIQRGQAEMEDIPEATTQIFATVAGTGDEEEDAGDHVDNQCDEENEP